MSLPHGFALPATLPAAPVEHALAHRICAILVDLFATRGVAQLRIDLAMLASDRYAGTQRLAGLIHAHPDRPHGILYRSRYDPDRPAMVLFGRAKPYVRLFPGAAPEPLARVPELAAGVRNQVPFVLV